jgi:hypothetical protein
MSQVEIFHLRMEYIILINLINLIAKFVDSSCKA